MNHVSFNISLDKVEEYRAKLVAKGIQVTPILHHTDISSFYFFDPDGILLEFAANVRKLGDPVRDLKHELSTVVQPQ